MNSNAQETLELYKLHAKLANNVTRNRFILNQVFISLNSLIIGFKIRIDMDYLLSLGISIFGIMLCIIWVSLIQHHRVLNQAKFSVLLELEKQLSFDFFNQEWKILKEQKGMKTYFEFTRVEKAIPVLFIVTFIGSHILMY